MTDSLHPTARDVLEALAACATGPGGLVVARSREQLVEGARCSLPAWKRWVGVLCLAGHVERVEGGDRWELGLRLTEAGLAAARRPAHQRAGVSQEASRSASPSFSSLSSSPSGTKKKEEEKREAGSPSHWVSQGEPQAPGSPPGSPVRVVVIECPDAETALRIFHDLEARGEIRGVAVSHPPAGAAPGPQPAPKKARTPLSTKDHNGRTGHDLPERTCCGARMVRRFGGVDERGPTWHLRCVSCSAAWDPATEGYRAGRQADEEQARRAKARPA